MISSDHSASSAHPQSMLTMSEEFIRILRERVATNFYDRPQVVEIIARAILNSRGLYPQG